MFSFCFLASLTKAMETPILGEKPTPVSLDLARVGLRAPPKAPLQVGAGPSEHAPPVDGGLIGLALVFLFDLAIVLVLNVRFCCRRRFCQYTKWVGGNPACSLQRDRRLHFIYFSVSFTLLFSYILSFC